MKKTSNELIKESIHKFLFWEYHHKIKRLKIALLLISILSATYFIFQQQEGILFLFIVVAVYLFFLFFPGENKKVILPEKFLDLSEPPFFYVKKEKGVYVPIRFSAIKYVSLEVDRKVVEDFKKGYYDLLSFNKKGEIEWKKTTI